MPRYVTLKLLSVARNSTVPTRRTADAEAKMRRSIDDVAMAQRRAYFDRFE